MELHNIDAEQVFALGFGGAVAALRDALRAGLDPETEPPRATSPLGEGELLTMPATVGDLAGVKVTTVAPANPSRGLPRIHAVYIVFDAATLIPLAVVDGTALTTLRTPALSALAFDLIAPQRIDDVVVFGTGPQAWGHVVALSEQRPFAGRVHVVGRHAGRRDEFVAQCAAAGVDAVAAEADAVSKASLVICATTARTPLFDGSLLRSDAVVIACGSHEPDAREVDAVTVQRCGGVVVEARTAALAEAGDVIAALAEQAITDQDLIGLAELEALSSADRPRFFKSVGMGWQDLAVAAAVLGTAREASG